MGHKINPNVFRLGISIDYRYQIRDKLLANIFIFRLIKSLLFQYSAPYVDYDRERKYEEEAETEEDDDLLSTAIADPSITAEELETKEVEQS